MNRYLFYGINYIIDWRLSAFDIGHVTWGLPLALDEFGGGRQVEVSFLPLSMAQFKFDRFLHASGINT